MATDLGVDLAEHWNGSRTPGAPVTTAEDFWPVLRILADAGLVTGSEEPLTTLQLGPFRLAQTPYREAARDFLDILLPSLVIGCAEGTPVHGAVAGTLASGTRGFIELLRRGVVFGRAPVDRLCWNVLMFVKERNTEGRHPTPGEVVTAFTEPEAHEGTSADDIRAAVEWLCTTGSADHPHPALLSLDTEDGLESLV